MAGLYTGASGFGLKANSLSDRSPNPSVPVGRLFVRMSGIRPIVFQALRPSKDPYMLAAVLENGRTMGMQAFECYPEDVRNPASQSALAAAKRTMSARSQRNQNFNVALAFGGLGTGSHLIGVLPLLFRLTSRG
jgi:hypothetical protein